MQKAGLPTQAPTRGDNGKAGDATTPGTRVANVEQQTWFADVATKVVLPLFKERPKPFALVFWSRDPDGTQHNQGELAAAPDPRHQRSDVAGRHPQRRRQPRAPAGRAEGARPGRDNRRGADVRPRLLDDLEGERDKLGGDADLCRRARRHCCRRASSPSTSPTHWALKLFDPDAKGEAKKTCRWPPASLPARANGLIGDDPAAPLVVVAANGGSDLIYLPKPDKALAARVVKILAGQDYVSGLFVDSTAWPDPRHAAAVRDCVGGVRADPDAGDRSELPLVLDRLRRPDDLRRGGRRHRPAAGPGHAWQLQPSGYAAISWGRWGPGSGWALPIPRRRATPISARQSRICWACRSRPRASWSAAC